MWRLVRVPESGFPAAQLGLIGLLGGLLWLTHNTAIVFVLAAAFVVWVRRPLSLRSIMVAGLIVVVPALMWLLLRLTLGQGESHRMGFGAGTYGLGEYLRQLIFGIGRMFVPDRAGLPWMTAIVLVGLVLLVLRRPNAAGLRFGVLTTLVATACLVVLISMVAVTSPLTTLRQILFIGLILLPLVALTAAAGWPRIVATALLLLALPQLYWTALYATGEGNARIGCPGAGGARRSRERQLFACVDRDFGAGALRQDRRSKTQDAAADHRDLPCAGLHRLAHGERAGTPGQRPPAAAMAVIVNDQSAADTLAVEARSGGAEGARTDGDVEDAIGAGADRCQDDRRFAAGARAGRQQAAAQERARQRTSQQAAAAEGGQRLHQDKYVADTPPSTIRVWPLT